MLECTEREREKRKSDSMAERRRTGASSMGAIHPGERAAMVGIIRTSEYRRDLQQSREIRTRARYAARGGCTGTSSVQRRASQLVDLRLKRFAAILNGGIGKR